MIVRVSSSHFLTSPKYGDINVPFSISRNANNPCPRPGLVAIVTSLPRTNFGSTIGIETSVILSLMSQ